MIGTSQVSGIGSICLLVGRFSVLLSNSFLRPIMSLLWSLRVSFQVSINSLFEVFKSTFKSIKTSINSFKAFINGIKSNTKQFPEC